MDIKVSVIIPAYNASLYIKRLCSCLKKQKLKDIEFIFVNDGSTDNTLMSLQKYTKEYSRFVVVSQSNQGSGAARNSGLNIAHGEYIGFVDSDDLISPDYFLKLYEKAVQNRADIAATTQVFCISSKGKKKAKDTGLHGQTVISSDQDKSSVVLASGMSYNKIYKRSFLFEHQLCFSNFRNAAEDNFFTMKAMIKAGKIAVEDQATYFYCKNQNSQTEKLKDRSQFSMIDVYKSLYSFISAQDPLKTDQSFWFEVWEKRLRKDIVEFYQTMNPLLRPEFLAELQTAFSQLFKPVIISLTSYPARIGTVASTIKSLLKQSYPFEKIVLWLAEEEFAQREKDLPADLTSLLCEKFEIRWCKNIRSYKKLIPALNTFQDKIIITTDDDIIYPSDFAERLMITHLLNPHSLCCHRAHQIVFDKAGNILPYCQWIYDVEGGRTDKNLFFTGVGGVLYPPQSLHDDVCREDLFMNLCPTGDDIWFWAMAMLRGTQICLVKNNMKHLDYIDGTQENCLWSLNSQGKNDEQLSAVLKKYPEIVSCLDPSVTLKNCASKRKVFNILGIKIKIKKKF